MMACLVPFFFLSFSLSGCVCCAGTLNRLGYTQPNKRRTRHVYSQNDQYFFSADNFYFIFFWQFLIIIRFNNCTVIITRMEVLLLLLLFSFERGRNTNDLFEFLMDDVRGPAYKVR
jgi:hypothetical protein